MKKIIIVLFCLILLTGCNKKEEEKKKEVIKVDDYSNESFDISSIEYDKDECSLSMIVYNKTSIDKILGSFGLQFSNADGSTSLFGGYNDDIISSKSNKLINVSDICFEDEFDEVTLMSISDDEPNDSLFGE